MAQIVAAAPSVNEGLSAIAETTTPSSNGTNETKPIAEGTTPASNGTKVSKDIGESITPAPSATKDTNAIAESTTPASYVAKDADATAESATPVSHGTKDTNALPESTTTPSNGPDVVSATNGTNGTSAANGTSSTTQFGPPLKGKVALITGAGRGIGAGIAKVLAEKGCKAVIINYSSSEVQAEKTRKELEALGTHAIAIKANLQKVDEIVRLFDEAVKTAGGLDIVVSNSGKEIFSPLLETTEAQYDDVMALNSKAQFFVGREALRHINENGTVVLMSSIAAGLGIKGHAIYGGSKNAVEAFTRCFSQDFGVKRCTVNAIAPAGIKSDMWADNAWRYAPGCDKNSSVDQIEAALAAGSPLNRVGYPEDIGKVVAFLASDDGRWINGQILPCNGGAPV